MALPEQVRVRAVEGIFAPVPGYAAAHGMQVEYVGRRVDHAAMKASARKRPDGVMVHGDPSVCYPIDPEHNSVFSSADGVSLFSSLRKMIIDGDIAAADETTARWAGVSMPAAAAKKFTPKPAAPAREESK